MSLPQMILDGSSNPLMLALMALVLGALHGLEPGHSKTMMAAYIIAIRGRALDAVLLGLSAAASHVIIVWVLAILALTYGNQYIGDALEPYLMCASGGVIIMMGAWVFWRSWHVRHHTTHHHHDHHDEHHHHHDHHHDHSIGIDPHALAHAREIEARLQNGKTSTWQTVLFGLSGGLAPCPAAVTVFLLCLHLEKFGLGITLVASFSIGLALMLIGVGLIAAIGLRYTLTRFSGLNKLLENAPFFSAALITTVGGFMLLAGLLHFG